MSELEIEIARQRAQVRREEPTDNAAASAVIGPSHYLRPPDHVTRTLIQEAHRLLRPGRSDTLIIYTSAPWYRPADRVTEIPTGLPTGPGATKRRWRTTEKHRCWVLGELGHRDSASTDVVHDGSVLLLDDGRAINIFSSQSHAIGKTIHLHVPGAHRDIAQAIRVYEHPLGSVVVLHDGVGGTQTLPKLLARCVLAYE